ncbi:MAG: hypothetical protein ACREFM_02420, partial [Hypericibacter sp.]
ECVEYADTGAKHTERAGDFYELGIDRHGSRNGCLVANRIGIVVCLFSRLPDLAVVIPYDRSAPDIGGTVARICASTLL